MTEQQAEASASGKAAPAYREKASTEEELIIRLRGISTNSRHGQMRADPRQKLPGRKRLHQVIVRSRL